MSSTIKQAIEALKSRVADAYTAIVAKGGTLPATQDSANLPSAIASIPSGGGIIRCSQFSCYGFDNDQFDTGSIYYTAISLYRTFRGNTKLKEIDCSHYVVNSNDINVLYQTFEDCQNAEIINLTGAVINFRVGNNQITEAFERCYKVKELDLRGINVPAGATIWGTRDEFLRCDALKTLRMSSTWRFDFNISTTGLQHDGLVQLFNDLGTITTTATITLGATKLGYLSADEIAIATNKGWTLA